MPSKPKPQRKPRRSARQKELDGLRAVADEELLDQIRRLLALPPHKRTHFLRVRLPNGGSSL